MLETHGRVVLVSGASRGIGAAIVHALAGSGFRVSAGARDPGGVATTDGGVHRFPYEASDPGSPRRWVAEALARHGRIDGVVCCAGIKPDSAFADDDEGPLDRMWDVNAKAPWRLAKAAWPHLAASGSGRVVVVGSLSGKRPGSNLGYSMTKAAAVMLARFLHREGWGHGIRVCSVNTGYVDTGMAGPGARVERGAMTRPEDVAEVVRGWLRLPNEAAMPELSVNCELE